MLIQKGTYAVYSLQTDRKLSVYWNTFYLIVASRDFLIHLNRFSATP